MNDATRDAAGDAGEEKPAVHDPIGAMLAAAGTAPHVAGQRCGLIARAAEAVVPTGPG